jgi:hypothetical protein
VHPSSNEQRLAAGVSTGGHPADGMSTSRRRRRHFRSVKHRWETGGAVLDVVHRLRPLLLCLSVCLISLLGPAMRTLAASKPLIDPSFMPPLLHSAHAGQRHACTDAAPFVSRAWCKCLRIDVHTTTGIERYGHQHHQRLVPSTAMPSASFCCFLSPVDCCLR